ncbi:2-oxoacid:ferredoxin oxidoreductase subunit beta [Candidatus Galacturonibacter soehngenii]|uniref:2-oxoacid:ferredoxin oxidoreductase subunit beta n=1 Tax=Candidatus Galacturonatibacter soehngenii TaxID=2307010 RepID=A0A7V7QM01_9FIRM|nr:2-oxoacid:ferredoxin oxidoreductase subunit beta [Candidatus Galacturonibacter soehngenii]KAB1439493.1 2-oxoacid:ferredoxin oxidoreductase subunit beta [Candidatus Galacturonibacter soehngenii]MBA4687007.1 2-oxoacid:ferredoxin oxidoreductase subunit beta [Candidatus Galacturonibacter soehngenii]
MNQFVTYETAWCPGCGNFPILNSLKTALEELGKQPHEVLMVAGIGQAAKTPQYLSANSYCGLHGRALPAAVAAKMANEKLTVIVNSGDGDSYGEGGNHFIHNIRRNVNITHFVHNNQIYGLTKGQASPTSKEGHVTQVQTDGNKNAPLNPILLAIAAGAGFVARASSGDQKQLISIMKEAINYPGYAFVDILQPCVSFNKINTYGYYKNAVNPVGEDHNPADKLEAIKIAMELGDKIPTGIIYREEKEEFHRKNFLLKDGIPLIEQETPKEVLTQLIQSFI